MKRKFQKAKIKTLCEFQFAKFLFVLGRREVWRARFFKKGKTNPEFSALQTNNKFSRFNSTKIRSLMDWRFYLCSFSLRTVICNFHDLFSKKSIIASVLSNSSPVFTAQTQGCNPEAGPRTALRKKCAPPSLEESHVTYT